MKARSSRRDKDNRAYEKICREKRERLIREDNWVCFLSGAELPIEGRVPFHHAGGRNGEAPDGGSLFLYEKWIVPVHPQRHKEYHDMPVGWLLQRPWYKLYLGRLESFDKELYKRELNRIEKL